MKSKADYYFMKSMIFAKNTLPIDEFNLYRQLFDIIYSSVLKPDLYILIRDASNNLVYGSALQYITSIRKFLIN